ncbi:MAG: serine hydrolase [Cyclobacteriaceae bacterium]|nr:serine hydrolase [Cyclobacteriaceae bacterium]
MMYKLCSALLLSLMLVNFSHGQPSTKNNAELNSISDSGLNKILDSVFSSLKNTKVPGVAVSVIQNGKIIAKKDYGMANIELQVPFSHRSVVRIGYSEAREFISIAAVLMENDGILSLHDQVRTYFPDLPEWSESVTVWDLLNHRSGFVDEWSTLLLMHGAMSNRFDKEQFFQLLNTQPEPEIEPGKGFMYCNSDFGLLRLIMEKASGENLSEWIKERIFDPLKMINTQMQNNALDIVPNRATKYEIYGNGFQQENVQKTSPGGNYFILTSADDLEKWSAAISDKSSAVNAAFERLTEKIRMIPGKKNHYLTGHSIDTINNHKIIFHEGVVGENYLSRIPSKGLSIITIGNLAGEGFAEQNKFICNYLMNVKKPPFVKPVFATKPIPMTEAELKKYEGRYRWLNQVSWESYNELRKLSNFYVEKSKLKVRYTGNYIIELIPVGKDVFFYGEGYGMQIKFIQPKSNNPMRVTVTFDDGYPGATMEKETGKWEPSKEDFKPFTGKYYSRHLDYYWNFDLNEHGKMVLRRATMPDAIIEPDGENQFHYIAEKGPGVGYDQWILFKKNSAGEIVDLTVWSSRLMHHRFEKQ